MEKLGHRWLVVACVVAACGVSRAETMQERKQRITRQYITQQQEVEQSGLMFLDPAELDERVLQSEMYAKNKSSGPEDQNSLMQRRVSVARPLPAQPGSDSSLLLVDEDDADMYADPFASDSGQDQSTTAFDLVSGWAEEREALASERQRNSDAAYAELVARRQQTGALGGTTQPSSLTTLGQNPANPVGGAFPTFGTPSVGGGLSIGTYTPSTTRNPGNGSTPSTLPGIVPRDPYSGAGQGSGQSTSIPEFTRPATSSDEWGGRNDRWDPTANDAYVNELMNGIRR